jgi:3-oxosteroid 1-dehydrogenase
MSDSTQPSNRGGAPQWDCETDLLVFGSGAGGLSASLFGTKQQMQVVLCEKSSLIGGTTATSGGVVWIPDTRQSREAGTGDSIDRAREYLENELGSYHRSDLIEAYLTAGNAALAAIEDGTEVKFDLISWSDYHPEQPGAVPKGRSLVARSFDGRLLGRDFALVRPPIHRLMILGGLMIGAEEIADFLNPFASAGAFKRVTRKLARYAVDRLRFRRGTDVRNGNALVSRLLLSLRRAGASIWLEAALVELIRDGERICGAVVNRGGVRTRVRARRGVVLATGGFPRNPRLREQLGKSFPHRHTLAFEGNTGDGIDAAVAVGAAVDTILASPGLWTPASMIRHPDGSETAVIYGYLDRGRPGVIAVNAQGRRFVNESNSYHDIVMAMFEQTGGREGVFHFVCDRNFVRKHGLGLLRPSPLTLSLKRWVEAQYITVADTLAELATRIGADPDTLIETVRKHNAYAKEGVDLEFGKGSNVYNRQFGDPEVKPNPNLAPIETPPYIALRIHPATLGTTIGLRTNGDACVTNSNGEAIPGLYACGNDLASAMRGFYPGGGVTLGPAIVFAYRAVQHASAQTDAAPATAITAAARARTRNDSGPERFLFVVFTNANEGREREYNEWYTNQHLADVVRLPGVTSAQRFELAEKQRVAPPHPWKYMAIYEIETTDLQSTIDALQARSGTADMPVSGALDARRVSWFFKPITDVVGSTLPDDELTAAVRAID